MATTRSRRSCSATARLRAAMAASRPERGGPAAVRGAGARAGGAVGVGERPGGAGLGRVDGDDAEVLGSDGLGVRGEQAVGLAEVLAAVGAAASGSRAGLHGRGLREWLRVDTTPAWRPTGGRRREEIYSLSKNFARYQRATSVERRSRGYAYR